MKREIVARDGVTISEEAIELSANESSRNPIAKGAQRKRVEDVVFEMTRIEARGEEAVRVIPERKGALHLKIAELSSGSVIMMLRDPSPRDGADFGEQHGACSIVDSAM